MKISKQLLCGVVCLALLMWAGPASGQVGIEIGVDYYTPEYYLDYPVFFDENGQPIYYVNGVVRYVPRSYAHYHGLVRHYRTHRHNYRRWYRARGNRYHRYRRVVAVEYEPLYYDGYVVYYDEAGRPYYYIDGRMVFIPQHHPRYAVYRGHYRQHGVRYRTWNRRHGHRYRAYRRAPAARVHHRPAREAPQPVHYGGRGAPAPHYGAPHGGGARVDCRRSPGHPACRRGGAAQPASPGIDCRRNPRHPACRRGGAVHSPAPHGAPPPGQHRREHRRGRHR